MVMVTVKVKTVGGGPTASHFFIRFAHPTGRPSGAQQTTLSTAKKVTKKAANRRRRLIATGASHTEYCPAVSDVVSPSVTIRFFYALLDPHFTSKLTY